MTEKDKKGKLDIKDMNELQSVCVSFSWSPLNATAQTSDIFTLRISFCEVRYYLNVA